MLPAAASGFFAVLAVDRARLSYNSEGRYFDAANSIVYHDTAPLGYGAMAISSLVIAVAMWFGFGRLRSSGRSHRSSVAKGVSPPPVASSRIEYLVRADGGSDWDLIIGDVDALIPRSGECEQVPDTPVLTVSCGGWTVQYSAEDPGWQLSFSDGTPDNEAREYVEIVASQLEERTGVKTRCIQISGFV